MVLGVAVMGCGKSENPAPQADPGQKDPRTIAPAASGTLVTVQVNGMV
jgi:hypothetical protein